MLRDIRFLLKPHYTNSHALVIGINDYKNTSPLCYAVSDAKEVRETIEKEFDFPPENITSLINEKATKINIMKEFLRFSRDDINLDDRIFIFYAGHGLTISGIRGEVGFLVPYDADESDFSSLIRWDELTRNADLIRAKHMLFIMDACYGGLALTRSVHPGSTRFLKDMMLRYSRQVLTAGKADEVVSDSGGPISNHSVFTGHLIEGLRGNAVSENGILTANGLMAYVYVKVANDKNSYQTPHYGHFDGDGDFIFYAPQLEDLKQSEEKDIDKLVVVPYSEEEFTTENTSDKIKKIKSLLSDDNLTIELHDYLIEEVRRFLSATSEDNFTIKGSFSKEELFNRISKYEDCSNDLTLLLACLAYWAKPRHEFILQKVIARSTDRLIEQSGLVAWLNMRWYPHILGIYCSGVAAVDGKRYDSLANIFYTTVGSIEYNHQRKYFVDAVANGINELKKNDVFKELPGHERQYTPMSEYLYKLLQPKLDDIMFFGQSYESSFDDFEVLFALIIIDHRIQNDMHIWGPIGRFGWKEQTIFNPPLSRIIDKANSFRENWDPLKAGLFGGQYERFNAAATELKAIVSRLNWW